MRRDADVTGPVIGLDLGGTKILGALIVDGVAIETKKRATPRKDGADGVVDAIVGVVETLQGRSERPVSRIGIGAPGVIASDRSTVITAPNLAGFDAPVPLGAAVGERSGLGTLVDNDVNVAMLAEHRLGAGRGLRDVCGLFLGTGVGGGLILDDRLRRGPNGLAGEIGHLVVRPGGRRCGCGGRGHLEAYAGRAGLERAARSRHADGESTMLVDLAGDGRMKSSLWARALDVGDPVAVALVDDAADALGAAIAAVAVVVDLEAVVIGGGLGERLGDSFLRRATERAGKRAFGPVPSVVRSGVGDLAGALGAGVLALGD